MKKRINPNKMRLILDGLLVLAVVLAIFSYRQPGLANGEQNGQTQTVIADNMPDLQEQNNSSTPATGPEVSENPVILDNETIAAVLAAENAALTPPQYLTTLPIATR